MKEMNLLPKEYLEAQKEKKTRKLYIVGTFLVASFLTAIYCGMMYTDYRLNKKITSVDAGIQELQSLKETQSRVIINEDILHHRRIIIQELEAKSKDQYVLITAMKDTLPQAITLASLSHPAVHHYHLTAETTNPDVIADFMVNLAKIKGVENVLLDHVQWGESGQGEKEQNISKFSLSFSYQSGEGNENDPE